MSRVYAVVEGHTEQAFVENVLAPWLGEKGVFICASLIGKPGHKGGRVEYVRGKSDILEFCTKEKTTFITTMIDFFRLPSSWPGRDQADSAHHDSKAQIVESAIHEDICKSLGDSFNSSRFISYVQMYEFEALLFSQPEIIADVTGEIKLAPQLAEIRQAFKTPEHINDAPTTAPSKRIESLVSTYKKRTDGRIAAEKIGMDRMLAECPHFAGWVERLLATNSTEPAN